MRKSQGDNLIKPQVLGHSTEDTSNSLSSLRTQPRNVEDTVACGSHVRFMVGVFRLYLGAEQDRKLGSMGK